MLIVITSPNGLSTRTYVVTIYVLMEEEEKASLGDLIVDHGQLEPTFMPDLFRYSLYLPSHRDRIALTPYSLSGEDIKVRFARGMGIIHVISVVLINAPPVIMTPTQFCFWRCMTK